MYYTAPNSPSEVVIEIAHRLHKKLLLKGMIFTVEIQYSTTILIPYFKINMVFTTLTVFDSRVSLILNIFNFVILEHINIISTLTLG